MDVSVLWKFIRDENDPMWHWRRVLYAYVRRGEILYVGKAAKETSSVWKRLNAGDKKRNVLEPLATQRKITTFSILVGDLSHDGNFSQELLTDVETLLISEIRPWANIHASSSRTARVGMRVRCSGTAWPHQRAFRDVA